MDALTLFVIVSVTGFAFSQAELLKRIGRLEEKHKNIEKSIGSTRSDLIERTTHLQGELIDMKLNPQPKPKSFTSEDLMKALGGRVTRCYNEQGEITTLTITAPWLKEPISTSIHRGYASIPLICNEWSELKQAEDRRKKSLKELQEAEVLSQCEYALKQLTASMAAKAKKK